MSHFSVAVITDAKPTKEEIAAILQPWHEFECTGIDDQYVQDIDGQWFEKGKMGWFGMSSGDKEDWDQTFDRMISETPRDHWVTIVDCHI